MPHRELSILRVEGKDDVHAISHLLMRHGVDCEAVAVDIRSPDDGGDETTGGRNALLEGMQTAVMSGTGRAVGFVLDADTAPENRWNAVRDRLIGVGIEPPSEIQREVSSVRWMRFRHESGSG